ncbi:MAG: DUF3293 domain-containing protein [Acidimicrobiales bacterium]
MQRDDDIWDAFAQAVVTIEMPEGPRRLEPRPVGEVGVFPFATPVHIITAHNPAGEPDDPVANERRHRELTEHLVGHRMMATVGSAVDGTMAEPGLGVIGLDDRVAIELGRRFGQLAIYRWTAEALEIVGIDEARRIESGWALVDARARASRTDA